MESKVSFIESSLGEIANNTGTCIFFIRFIVCVAGAIGLNKPQSPSIIVQSDEYAILLYSLCIFSMSMNSFSASAAISGSDFDLNMLLSNLMDNALEAIEKTEERVLTIRIKYIKRMLYISVYNSYDGNVKKEGNRLLTTKAKKEEHGIGMTCIRSIVDKYQGEMTVQTVEDMFKTDIIMYV